MTKITKDIETVKQVIQSIDITGIARYTKKVSEIPNITRLSAPEYIRDFIMAYDLVATMLSDLTRYFLRAKSSLDTLESIAYVDKAADFLKSKEIKDTDAARKRYIDIDEEVIEARDLVSQITAMDQLLKNKLTLFKAAHDDVKKIYYADPERSVFEGM